MMAQQHVDAPTIRRKIVDENAGGGGGRGNGRNAEAGGAVQEGAWEKENVHPVGPHERKCRRSCTSPHGVGIMSVRDVRKACCSWVSCRRGRRMRFPAVEGQIVLVVDGQSRDYTPVCHEKLSTANRVFAAAAHGAAARIRDFDTLRTAAGQQGAPQFCKAPPFRSTVPAAFA